MAGISLGSTTLQKVALGSTEVKKISLGDVLVWSAVVPTYGSIGAGVAWFSTANFNFTAPSGYDLIAFVATDRTTTVTLNIGGTAMTELASVANNNVSTYGAVHAYRRVGGGTGSAQTVAVSTTNGSWAHVNVVAVSGVSSVSTVSAYGNSTSLSHSVTVSSGQLAIQAFGTGNAGSETSVLSSPTGGTNRYLLNVLGADLSISTATSTATFGASLGSANPWSSLALVLS
ncbi:hypothetical protein SEA_KILLIGREW_4 [Mycobacterium phage Killigrew]|nr:hypothetical protein SEA_KILLIGREW_4 [Mycobacterium phage Killigrew]